MKGKSIVNAIMITLVSAGVATATNSAIAGSSKMEKCYGVVKKGKNDCGTPKHACAAQAKKNNDSAEWVFLPKGSCNKLTGGTTKSDK